MGYAKKIIIMADDLSKVKSEEMDKIFIATLESIL